MLNLTSIWMHNMIRSTKFQDGITSLSILQAILLYFNISAKTWCILHVVTDDKLLNEATEELITFQNGHMLMVEYQRLNMTNFYMYIIKSQQNYKKLYLIKFNYMLVEQPSVIIIKEIIY